MKFSIGYNQKPDFINLLNKYKNNLSSVYFALPKDIVGSGRDKTQSNEYNKEIEKIISICVSYNIDTIAIMNATCEGKLTGDKNHMLKMISYIKKLQTIGLSSITLTNLLYLPFFRKAFPSLIIYSSINCYLKNHEEAIYYKELGIDILTIDRDINRKIDVIKKIKKSTGLKLQILLNEGCFSNCPYRKTHFNIAAHGVDYNTKGRFGKGMYNLIEKYSCVPMVNKNKNLIFRAPFIRPEDLIHYKGLIDVFKLDTRPESTDRIDKMLEAYISGYYNGNLNDIIDFPYQNVPIIDNNKLTKLNFFNKISKCPGNCNICNICEDFF